jgi:hypothetical protein
MTWALRVATPESSASHDAPGLGSDSGSRLLLAFDNTSTNNGLPNWSGGASREQALP